MQIEDFAPGAAAATPSCSTGPVRFEYPMEELDFIYGQRKL